MLLSKCATYTSKPEDIESKKSLAESYQVLGLSHKSGEYFFEIFLDGQAIEFVADTGSSDVVANGPSNICATCKTDSVYTPSETASTNYRTVTLGYGSGKGSAKEYNDSSALLCQDSNDAHQQPFALLNKNNNLPNILGLAFKGLSTSRLDPFFDLLVKNSKGALADVFTMTLCGYRGGSKLILGNIDPLTDYSKMLIAEIPKKTFYSIDARKLLVEGWVKRGNSWQQSSGKHVVGDFNVAKTIPTIIDSGTTLNYPPRPIVDALVSLMQKVASTKKLNIATNSWTAKEKDDASRISMDDKTLAAFPNLIIEMRANDKDTFIQLVMTPQNYFKRLGSKYIFSFRVHETTLPAYIFGQPFYENFEIVHNKAEGWLGFVRNDAICGVPRASSPA